MKNLIIFNFLISIVLTLSFPLNGFADDLPETIGFHKAVYDENGKLLPWTPWSRALVKEMNWYLNCPVGKKGYPVFLYTTFMDENYKSYRTDFIPATQLSMGIISYIKYFYYTAVLILKY